MKNTIYTDADLNALLLRGEEYDGNTIEIVIDADNTANQELTIAAGDASTTETITPGTRNTVEIPRMIWNFGGATTVTLSKNGTDAETITLTFPAAIDVDAGAALNETETANEYRMDGSQSLQQQITSLQEQLQTFSMQTIDYILPSAISQADIADGSSNTVLTFEISCDDEDARTAMLAEIQFLAETTVTGSTYGDLLLTASIALDGNAVGTLLKTYRDGRQVLKIDYLFENLSKGNHEMTVTLAAAGGGLSLMQILSAFLLAAKSSGEQYTQMPLFTNGQWAPGVLADGLDPDKMTEEAMLDGIENIIIKFSVAATPNGEVPDISTLSEFYNSSFILLNGAHYAEPFYKTNGYFTKQGTHGIGPSTTGQPIGQTNIFFYIPIKRLTGFKKLVFEAKQVKDNGTGIGQPDYNLSAIGCGAVVNGTMNKVISTEEKNIDWTTREVNISSLPYIDYIILDGIDGAPGFRNIRLVK
jgi:hypothetical protein